MHKKICNLILVFIVFFSFSFTVVGAKSLAYKKFKGQNAFINVYNWGEYISNGSDGLCNVNQEFEELTGVHVNYTTFASNEEMYAKLKSGSIIYDVIIPSDYMISKMIEEEFLARLDFRNIPNYKNISESFKAPSYDPKSEYSVPFSWGLVGIIYNQKFVDIPVESFDVLWDKRFSKNILMFQNSRDAFGIALKRLGLSVNTKNKEEIERAALELRKQKNLVQAYVMDETFDKMQSEEAYVAPYYSGDAQVMMAANPNLRFKVPNKSVIRFVDAVCVPKNSKKKEMAELYINFLCEPGIALDNALHGGYSTPNKTAQALMPKKLKNNSIVYPSEEVLASAEGYIHVSSEIDSLIDSYWVDILIADENNGVWVMPVFLVVCLAMSIFAQMARKKGRLLQNQDK